MPITTRLGVGFALLAVLVAAGGRAAHADPVARVDLVGTAIRYNASQGQTNRTFLRHWPMGATMRYIISDVVPITSALPACRLVSPPPDTTMYCDFPVGNVTSMIVQLWDRDDLLTFDWRVPGLVQIDAGDGNDTLNMDDLHDTELVGPTIVNAGRGDDVIVTYHGDDAINGGDGVDTVSYRGRGPVHASLAAGVGGEVWRGERDTYTGVENLVGSPYGGNVLVGDARQNILWGGGSTEGDDVLIGMAGDDLLFGRHGVDHLFGGPGSDFLYGGTGADHLHGDADPDACFPGADGGTTDGCEWTIPGAVAELEPPAG
jgi:Ca2+-binding RTX toxin-like protein